MMISFVSPVEARGDTFGDMAIADCFICADE